MPCAPTKKEREAALDKLLPFQRADFEGVFRAMRDPKTGAAIRRDPPDRPAAARVPAELRRDAGRGTRLEDKAATRRAAEKRKLLVAIAGMREMNPMLGLRGCRLGLVFPEINVMQTRAILEAARNVAKDGIKLQPKIISRWWACQRATRGAPPARSGGAGDRR